MGDGEGRRDEVEEGQRRRCQVPTAKATEEGQERDEEGPERPGIGKREGRERNALVVVGTLIKWISFPTPHTNYV